MNTKYENAPSGSPQPIIESELNMLSDKIYALGEYILNLENRLSPISSTSLKCNVVNTDETTLGSRYADVLHSYNTRIADIISKVIDITDNIQI